MEGSHVPSGERSDRVSKTSGNEASAKTLRESKTGSAKVRRAYPSTSASEGCSSLEDRLGVADDRPQRRAAPRAVGGRCWARARLGPGLHRAGGEAISPWHGAHLNPERRGRGSRASVSPGGVGASCLIGGVVDGHRDPRALISKTVMGVIRPSRVRIPPPPLRVAKRPHRGAFCFCSRASRGCLVMAVPVALWPISRGAGTPDDRAPIARRRPPVVQRGRAKGNVGHAGAGRRGDEVAFPRVSDGEIATGVRDRVVVERRQARTPDAEVGTSSDEPCSTRRLVVRSPLRPARPD